jgi:hypothetical protein
VRLFAAEIPSPLTGTGSEGLVAVVALDLDEAAELVAEQLQAGMRQRGVPADVAQGYIDRLLFRLEVVPEGIAGFYRPGLSPWPARYRGPLWRHL